ncbi:MAG: GNAT family N-acetyltransferase [Planctomycetes bacterium]|nr:GNAT family N-acetyltransferase [Planctomycetota bacterium]
MEGPRPVRPEEFDSLIELINSIFTNEHGHMRESFPLLFDYRNCENLWVFVDNATVVSHVGTVINDVYVMGCRLKVASVGSVGTHQDYRGRGLAGACLAAAEQSAVEKGASITLISGSRSLYARFGAVQVGRALAVGIPAGAADRGLEVTKAAPRDAVVLERLYEREPVRFHRPLEDWKAALKALDVRCSDTRKHAVYIFSEHGEPAASCLCSAKHDEDGWYAWVREFAGSRSHVVGGLPAAAAALEAPSIKLKAPDFDPVLQHAIAAKGLSGRVDYLLGHTVKVSSLKNFVRDLKPCIEERLGRAGAGGLAFQEGPDGAYDVIVGEEHLPLAPAAFTALAFGGPAQEAPEGPGEMQVLGGIFPVGLPFPGLNYV